MGKSGSGIASTDLQVYCSTENKKSPRFENIFLKKLFLLHYNTKMLEINIFTFYYITLQSIQHSTTDKK